MNEWDERFDYYARSRAHAEGDDLDQVVAWCAPAPGVTALDVATGGGHVARRLRELGAAVTSCDAAAGMQPDVVCPAEDLPFADGSFDVVVCRVAAHHFTDPARAVARDGPRHAPPGGLRGHAVRRRARTAGGERARRDARDPLHA